jgi:hypothetical protein
MLPKETFLGGVFGLDILTGLYYFKHGFISRESVSDRENFPSPLDGRGCVTIHFGVISKRSESESVFIPREGGARARQFLSSRSESRVSFFTPREARARQFFIPREARARPVFIPREARARQFFIPREARNLDLNNFNKFSILNSSHAFE